MKTSTTLVRKKISRVLLAVVFWAAVWQGAAMAVDLPLLLPGPIDTGRALVLLASEGEFWGNVALTLVRILGGFLLGVAAGFVLAVLTAFVPILDVLLSPAVRLIRATPVASFILLCMLWLTSGFVPLLIAALMVLPVVWENVTQGFRNTDRKLLEMAKVFRMGRMKTFFRVYLPSVSGYLRAGLISSMGMAFKSGVAAEVLCQSKLSIGSELYYTKLYLETEQLFAWTAVVVVLSICMERLLIRLLKRKK